MATSVEARANDIAGAPLRAVGYAFTAAGTVPVSVAKIVGGGYVAVKSGDLLVHTFQGKDFGPFQPNNSLSDGILASVVGVSGVAAGLGLAYLGGHDIYTAAKAQAERK